ncbi:hypothetical protein DLE60_23245 [Micromonospora globispora]|uniref:helix-turn-helix domain-containing protein n=1 Tax=Micromonospora globispora TaxID=1450148 RepID=UPI000D6FA69D|nr:helix-turn-helix transcriptional regulator [Micromonospora globispora]PWU58076.1 hypothetical protein DLE60_23245 [Micromonospora globispora]
MTVSSVGNAATPLQRARLEQGWKQSRVIAALTAEARKQGLSVAGQASLKTMLSRWENGGGQPDAVYQRLFCAIYELDHEDLGFGEPEGRPGGAASRVAPSVDVETVDYFRSVFDQHIRADNLMGPHHLVDVVRAQAALLDQILPDAKNEVRDSLLVLACRYNEFAGWLYQDAGDPPNAMHFSDRAMDYALTIGDPTEVAYLLMRKSNIASDLGGFDRAIGLSTAALRDAQLVSPRVRALVLGQRARAYSRRGNAEEAVRALDAAIAQVTRPGAADADEVASYCTPAYLDMQAATCWVDLDSPDKAIPVFEEALANMPSVMRRDQGICQARLANAHAALGDRASTCQVGYRAVQTVGAATSARALRELRQLRQRLAPWRRDEEVSELSRAIKRLTTA